ncbi:biotin--[acetyl-CoA-carboxylase] ligase [Aeoliella mucimassa]|uniref:biotin--[biotin carboxyl-carrier protein] ligase n=1 Tax=Aeoliella mucimassa TaxID=2527972 RepID=A0A518AJA7_9BACT|nr:biotin--[acetyl-CoA-carboxylase] ligase [Aeoliella mucimassa]QDU54805.1 Bifunctional ligase/repressor BirA [Aeoliella mucimassa]
MHSAPLELARITQDTWIDRVHFFDQIDSTNNAALAHAAKSTNPLAELFVTDQQSAGRGRGSNRWWSGEGSLTWSVLTPPLECSLSVLPQVSLTMGLAIISAVEQFIAGDVTLKWPNDVFLNEAKVSGILIELAGTTKRLVVGVGLNVNNTTRDAPEELRRTATSMIDVQSDPEMAFDRTAVLVACLQQIDQYLQRFLARDPQLPDEWRAHSLLTGRQIQITTPRGDITGTCDSIADDGALVVQTPAGTEHCYGGVVANFA